MSATCLHIGTVSLRRRPRAGRMVVQAQCEKCRVFIGDAVDAREYDEEEYRKIRPMLPARSSGSPKTKRRREYKKALASARHKKIRQQVIARARGECESCGGQATEAHHKPGVPLESEDPNDYVAACRDCNQAERSARITRRVLG